MPQTRRSDSNLACPSCGLRRLTVVDSRVHSGSIRRRRRCDECGVRQTTYEVSAFEKRLVEQWIKDLEQVRGIASMMVSRINALESRIRQAARDQVLIRDLEPGERRPIVDNRRPRADYEP